jgi:hypothetical protein
MRSKRGLTVTATAAATAYLLLPILLIAANAFGANDCDRACLKTTLDQYLNAVVKHDPAAAPLFVGFRQTENAVVVKTTTGLWKSLTGLGKVQRRYFDPVSGQAAYYGIIEEGSAADIATVRIKVEDKKIAEAEWIISRKTDIGLNGTGPNLLDIDNLIANPPPDKPMPRDAKLSREALMATVNSYFDGITTHDGSIINAYQGCTRIENGVAMTGRGSRNGATSDCTSGLATINILNVAARRFPIVDDEAGVVLGMAVFIRKPGTTTRRNVFSEWFYIDKGRIRTIYTAMFYPDSDLPVPNWPPYDGNWPVK